jgi:hypothetical protein
MPHLLNFMTGKGTLLTNDHTVLISHTATGILTSLTGVYGACMGQLVSKASATSTRTARPILVSHALTGRLGFLTPRPPPRRTKHPT